MGRAKALLLCAAATLHLASSSALQAEEVPSFPAPHWWEQGGHSVRGVWPKCALGEGLGEVGQMRGLGAFMAMLDRLYASNVTTLQMVVYDSGDGYDPDDLWCGLAGSNYSKPLTNIGTEADWLTFIDAAHARNMTVTSFWNVAYFWTGSPAFKQAEADVRTHGLDALPEASPARWFRWSNRRSRHTKPADDKPNTNWCSDWVWDPDVNASYYGVWGCQPTTDFASSQWRAEMQRIITRWIVDLKLDGFMFDAPDAELGAGIDGAAHSKYNPALIRESMSDVIHNASGGRASILCRDLFRPTSHGRSRYGRRIRGRQALPTAQRCAPLALSPSPLIFPYTSEKSLCGAGKYCPPNVRSSAIGQAILTANASLFEVAMTGPGSVDDVAAQVFRAPGGRFRASYLKDLPVTVSWLPGSQATNGSGVFAENLNCSLGAGASYAPPDLPAPVTLTECFSHCRVDPQCDAVRVNWFTIPSNWTSVKIGCGLRGGIELASCTVQAPVYSRVGTVQYSTFAVDAPSKSQLVVAVTALAGYLPVVRNSGNDWTTSVAPWPGEQGGSLPRLLVAMRDESSLSLKALRMRVPAPSSEAHYGMLRYDALGTGRAAIIAINLGATRSDVQLDLTGLPKLVGQRPTSLICNASSSSCPLEPKLADSTSIAVEGHGFAGLTGLQLPRWAPQGYLNCSAVYSPPVIGGAMPLADCLVACLRDAKCDGVAVDWVQPHSWPKPASMAWYGNYVDCHLRGGFNLTKCDEDPTKLHSTITIVSEEVV